MQQDRRLWHATIIPCVTPYLKNVGAMLGIIAQSPVVLHKCSLDSLIFGTVIPTSFTNLMKCFYSCFTSLSLHQV